MSQLGNIERRDDGYWLCIVEPFSHILQTENGFRTISGGQYMKISKSESIWRHIRKFFGLHPLRWSERKWAAEMVTRALRDA